MSSEEKFRQSLRSLVESKEFPFQESEWDRAAAYIDRQRAMRRWRLGGLIVLLCVIGGVAFLALGDGTAASGPAVVAQARTVAATPDPETASAPTIEAPEVPAASVTGEDDLSGRETVNSPAHPPVKSAEEANPPATSASPQESPEISARGRTALKIARVHKAQEGPLEPGHNGAASASASLPVTLSPALGDNKEIIKDQGSAPVLATEPVKAGGESPVTAATETEEAEISKNTFAQEVPPVQEKEETPAEAPAETVKAEVAETPVPRDSLLAKAVRQQRFSLEAGPAYHFGWKEAAGSEAAGLNLTAGAHYLSQVNEKVFMSFGIQYQRLGHLSLYKNESKTTKLSFGEESDVMVIAPRKLHYIAVPLRFYYDLDAKNTFGASYTIGYLLDVESDVESYSLKAGKKSGEKSYSTRGYTDGFAMFDNQAGLFYRRSLGRCFAVQAEVFLGLTDLKQDNFFGGSKYQRSSGARIMMCYRIFQ